MGKRKQRVESWIRTNLTPQNPVNTLRSVNQWLKSTNPLTKSGFSSSMNGNLVSGGKNASKTEHRFNGSMTPGLNEVNKKARIAIPRSLGVGYVAPGPVFTPYKERVKVEFSFEIQAAINKRNFMRMGFRSYHQGLIYDGTTATVYTKEMMLDPRTVERTIAGHSMNTTVRNANNCIAGTVALGTDIFYPPVGLYDLECYSWNANPFKYMNWNLRGEVLDNTLQSTGSNSTSLKVFKDVMRSSGTPTTVPGRFTFSPFNAVATENNTAAAGWVKKGENYLCNLGPGVVDLHCNNKFNTPCVIEVVVVKLRKSPIPLASTTGSSTPYGIHEDAVSAAYVTEMTSGNFINPVGFQGETPVAADVLTNPNKKFLYGKKKFMVKDLPTKEVSRERYQLTGGSKQQITIRLPEHQYDAVQNRLTNLGGTGTATDTYARDGFTPASYIVYFAVHGVIMPVFAANVTGTLVTSVHEEIVDTQTCPASVLVHGRYTESPRPCLSVSPTYNMQLNGELIDTTFVSSTGKALVSGFIPGLPVPVTSQTVVATGITGNPTSTV